MSHNKAKGPRDRRLGPDSDTERDRLFASTGAKDARWKRINELAKCLRLDQNGEHVEKDMKRVIRAAGSLVCLKIDDP